MKIRLIYIGKSKKNFFLDEEKVYISRIKKYCNLEVKCISPIKGMSSLSGRELKDKEAELFVKEIKGDAIVILMDEKGRHYDSHEFAKMIENKLATAGQKDLCFLIGGASGFSERLKETFPHLIALSKLTMAHHLARIVLLEQVYRAFSILNNEPYHNN